MIIFIRSAGVTSGCSGCSVSDASSSEAMSDDELAKNPSNLVRNLSDGVSGSAGDGAELLDASDVGVGIWVIQRETQVSVAFNWSKGTAVAGAAVDPTDPTVASSVVFVAKRLVASVAVDRSTALLVLALVAVDRSTASSLVVAVDRSTALLGVAKY